MNKDNIKLYTYYLLIAVISILALAFLPMLSTSLDVDWAYPTTVPGKVVWWTTKCLVALINILIFYSFREQAKVNIRDNANYREALEILNKLKNKEVLPRSPKKYNGKIWATKGISIAIGSAAGTIALTQAILAYDWVTMLSYLFTIIMGLVFGVIQMNNDEIYYTTEMLEYAHLMQQKETINNDN